MKSLAALDCKSPDRPRSHGPSAQHAIAKALHPSIQPAISHSTRAPSPIHLATARPYYKPYMHDAIAAHLATGLLEQYSFAPMLQAPCHHPLSHTHDGTNSIHPCMASSDTPLQEPPPSPPSLTLLLSFCSPRTNTAHPSCIVTHTSCMHHPMDVSFLRRLTTASLSSPLLAPALTASATCRRVVCDAVVTIPLFLCTS